MRDKSQISKIHAIYNKHVEEKSISTEEISLYAEGWINNVSIIPISEKGESKLPDNFKNYPNTLNYFVVLALQRRN